MRKVLERYQQTSPAMRANSMITKDLELSLCAPPWSKRIYVIESLEMYLNGENLGGLEMKDLQNLENQIQASVDKIRATKGLLMSQENVLLKSKILRGSSTHADSMLIKTKLPVDLNVSAAKGAFTDRNENDSTLNIPETSLKLGICRYS
ncbi:hypothetical protein KP509_07G004300 [Ceratopteris richardii]|uniref:K-box domain-containing protein n=1 Tax=Ceratopteris richardii TaxID=49495 RepID=A0A8T2UHX5_CERRI|nr:hypothetical protein KP509_07G004300 [Ceratopteris richardii]